MKLNGVQVNVLFSCLTDRAKDNNKDIRQSCAKAIGYLSRKLNEKQIDYAFQYLVNGLKDEDKYVCKSCIESLEVLSAILNPIQLEEVFKVLLNVSKNLMKSYNSQQKDSECIKALQAISVKLNDHQLYLLVEHLLEKAKHRPTVYTYNALSEMSKDMWKRVIITVLKKEENQNKLMNKDSQTKKWNYWHLVYFWLILVFN
ncbi:hypothetical protein RFI_25239 [Reticulomyxa filosa]|uniref:Uncharacterized protein n=1 Tax=Reticulomyxa filosa TaxID=46433 RepID=X6MEN2_RETFI|nr:hypothetical protein RFI_25239 [Reticulomyxa filosa]|eukprot:ETO12136.1 hypothetical protein RFI_25239 [Reticulomyxa filosa]